MRNIILLNAFFLLLLIGCKKPSDDSRQLSAQFKIENTNAAVKEGDAVQLTVGTGEGSSCQHHSVSYHWDLGNGKTCDSKIPCFHYGMHGAYNITLTVTDDEGKTASYTRTITVLCIFIDPNHAPLI
jgi:immune inhibitor A